MRAKDRHLINRFLLWFPATAVGVLAFYVTTAIAAAAIWPEAKNSVADQYAWALSLVSRPYVLAAIAITILWLIAFFYTRDTDDKSQEGEPLGTYRAMTENDNRKGFFNDAPNYGSQTYNESPAQRLSPPLGDVASSAINSRPKVQIRVYGTDNEMQRLGHSIGNQLKSTGAEVIWFGQDGGTRYLEGIVIEPAPNDVSIRFAQQLATAFANSGLKVAVEDGPTSWGDDPFVRVAVGDNG